MGKLYIHYFSYLLLCSGLLMRDFYLGVICLLNLFLVHLDLQLVLVPHLYQCLRQLALELLLVAIVQLDHARLVAALHLPQFLLGKDKRKYTQT